ncbi:hypothetical protein HYV82_00435 [Candidatus Woesearchaeota archaeon]|nr:hypothetical protein [Candidatus Woesearchaeota archaeon]
MTDYQGDGAEQKGDAGQHGSSYASGGSSWYWSLADEFAAQRNAHIAERLSRYERENARRAGGDRSLSAIIRRVVAGGLEKLLRR